MISSPLTPTAWAAERGRIRTDTFEGTVAEAEAFTADAAGIWAAAAGAPTQIGRLPARAVDGAAGVCARPAARSAKDVAPAAGRAAVAVPLGQTGAGTEALGIGSGFW